MVSNNLKVCFYEWSDPNRTPLKFTEVNDFISFCNISNIPLNKRQLNFIKNNNVSYAICAKKYTPDLVLSGDYRNMRKNFSKHNNIRYLTEED